MAEALYRKYRSADFSEVVGQDHVVKTLMTAIANGRLSHAYLFTGPRGTGKTSVARLLARALNCTADNKPCNSCPLCVAAINTSLDVIEIDAASNRSIDAVRELREKVSISPSQGKYKIYIVDEVHMLTTEAFNALLKTLEEPPSHAVFILATTEAHKLPETIISRTQRFAFKPHTHKNIVEHLGKIATAENIQIEKEALDIVAAMARGGFRDAIGMLDQLSTSGERPVTAATVRSLLGLSDTEAIATVSKAIAKRDAKNAIVSLTALLDEGAQPGQVAQQLAGFWREALLAAVGAASDDPAAAALAKAMNLSRLSQGIESFLESSRSPWPRETLEVAVVKLAAEETETTATPAAPASATAKAAPRTAQVAPTAAKTPAETAPAPAASSDAGAELWPKVLITLRSRHNALAATLHQYTVEMSGDTVTIKSRFNFHRDLFLKPINRKIIEEAAQKVYGRAVSVTAVTDESAQPAPRKSADPNAELVSSALEILGGEVVD